MTTLVLYDRPAEGTSVRLNLEGIIGGWRRTKRAVGGYYMGTFSVTSMGMPQLTDFYNTWLGMKIVERSFGMISYEGIIWQLDLIKNGINYRRTLNPKFWHNRVRVDYTDKLGVQTSADWSENTDSSAIYGEMEYIEVLGVSNSTGATALRDRELVEYAWPRSRTVGGVSVGDPSPSLSGDGLYITTAGFWATLNWQYYESESTAAANTLISTLIGLSEFVTAGRIETNSLSIIAKGSDIPQRIGDLIEVSIRQGDSSGNIWKGGVYTNQEFIYEQAPTTVDYILRNGALYDNAGVMVNPALINPGFYVRDTNAPTGIQPPGSSNIWDDPQVSYCDEVEFIWPDTLILKFPGESLAAETLLTQLQLRPPGRKKKGRKLPPPPPVEDDGSDENIGYDDPNKKGKKRKDKGSRIW